MSENEEIQLRQQVDRARRVKEILTDEVFQNAVEMTKRRLFEEWQNSPLENTAQREGAFFALRGLDRVMQILDKFSGDGAVAENTLKTRGKR